MKVAIPIFKAAPEIGASAGAVEEGELRAKAKEKPAPGVSSSEEAAVQSGSATADNGRSNPLQSGSGSGSPCWRSTAEVTATDGSVQAASSNGEDAGNARSGSSLENAPCFRIRAHFDSRCRE